MSLPARTGNESVERLLRSPGFLVILVVLGAVGGFVIAGLMVTVGLPRLPARAALALGLALCAVEAVGLQRGWWKLNSRSPSARWRFLHRFATYTLGWEGLEAYFAKTRHPEHFHAVFFGLALSCLGILIDMERREPADRREDG
ncbi:MAG TPA: hypothetical protein VMI31_11125 [Fimbriimonadaceae bacterium]|nr:hypothetical protein [Fimbriimonadaceae bacterium]